MKRVLAASLLASLLAIHLQADAAEGRVSDSPPAAPDPSRVSSYVRGGKDESVATEQHSESAATKQHSARASSKTSAGKALRSASESLSTRASHFYIFDAGSLLIADRDADGYHSEFRIRFDADSQIGDALVYARLYLRRVGEIDWLLYHETDDFWIFGQSGSDDYFVTTTLDDGFPTGEYDVLIDLYESGFSGIVATIGPRDSGALSLLPLEEAGLDVPIELPGYSIRDVSTTLLIDSDGDGHYSRFRITFDPDSDFDGTYVYARIWVRPQGGSWIEEHVSEDFLVDSGGTEDLYSLTADWISGYPTAFYDVQIDLHAADSGALVASAGSERPELSRIPLEDQSRDRFVSPPADEIPGDTTSRERGGGAITGAWMLALLLFVAFRRLLRRSAGFRAG